MNADKLLQESIKLYTDLMKKVLTASIYEESAWQIIISHSLSIESLRRPLHLIRSIFKYFFIRTLQKRSLILLRVKPFSSKKRDEGRDWPFIGYTMVGIRRLENVQACLEDVLQDKVPGDLIETGAWRGGTTIFMRALLKAYGVTDRIVWVADSFEGLPRPKDITDGWDLSQVQYLKVSLEEVKSNFAKFGLLDEQVKFLQGWFCDTLPNAPIQKLAILRLDGNLYHSTMDSLQNLYHKVSKGGYVIIDDYYSWPSCRQAVTDFLSKHSLQADIKEIDNSGVYWRCE